MPVASDAIDVLFTQFVIIAQLCGSPADAGIAMGHRLRIQHREFDMASDEMSKPNLRRS
jgi:hypothetical protein